jgi:acyl-ACP thioesterase
VTIEQPLTPATGDGYNATWPVRTGDVDSYNRLRLDGVARYLQDVAWDALHSNFMAETDPTWFVRRWVIDVIRPVNWPTNVALRQWCAGMSTRWVNWRVDITDDDDGLIETEGFWINFSEATNAPARISDDGLAYLETMTAERRLRWHQWLTDAVPPQSDTDLSFPVRATDIDQYNHVNNAAYWQAVEQYLVEYPKLIAGPHRAVIEYNSTVLAREHISVRARFEPNDSHSGRPTLRLWFLVGDTVSTTVKIMPYAETRARHAR